MNYVTFLDESVGRFRTTHHIKNEPEIDILKSKCSMRRPCNRLGSRLRALGSGLLNPKPYTLHLNHRFRV